MKTTTAFLTLTLAILLAGCQQAEAPSGDAAKAAGDARVAVAQAPAVAADPLDPKALLTDEMLGKYVVYQNTMLPVMGDTLALGVEAIQKSGGDQKELEKQMAADPRLQRVNAAAKEAAAKTGLTEQTSAAIGKIVSEYVAKRTIGTDADKAQARTDFEKQYGAAAAAAVEKHEAELTKLQDEAIKAAMGPAKK